MIVKTASGLVFLDEPYGGIFSGRSVLISGRSGTGKTVAGFQFVQKGIQQEERSLILSTMPADDLTILAESLGFTFAIAVDRGQLILLEYQSFVPGQTLDWSTIPAEGFDQLREIIEVNSITRVVLDTVLPWISVADAEVMNKHVFSFVRSFDRLGVTTLMTMPKPVSSMAFRLKKAVDGVVPISVLLSTDELGMEHTWQTLKYLGEKPTGGAEPYQIQRGLGILPLDEAELDDSPPVELRGDDETQTASRPTASSTGKIRDGRVRFADKIVPKDPSDTSCGEVSKAPSQRQGPARLASVWKPE